MRLYRQKVSSVRDKQRRHKSGCCSRGGGGGMGLLTPGGRLPAPGHYEGISLDSAKHIKEEILRKLFLEGMLLYYSLRFSCAYRV